MDLDSKFEDSNHLVVQTATDETSPLKITILDRYERHGITSLTDAELLQITLFKGKEGKAAAASLLRRYEHLHELYAIDTATFESIPGVGPMTVMRLEALMEITRRMKPKPHDSNPIMRTPTDVAGYYITRLRGELQERFIVLLLNSANRMYKEVVVSIGSLNASIVHPREVFRQAISSSAASLIVVHNHPSGNPEPSREDLAITKQLSEAGKILDIKLLDHIIIAGDSFTSLRERQLM